MNLVLNSKLHDKSLGDRNMTPQKNLFWRGTTQTKDNYFQLKRKSDGFGKRKTQKTVRAPKLLVSYLSNYMLIYGNLCRMAYDS